MTATSHVFAPTPRYDRASLIREGAPRMADAVLFWGHHPARGAGISMSCMSQWFESVFIVGDQVYTCMEQYMMAGKARLFGDHEALECILREHDPMKIKKAGRLVKNFDPAVWDGEKYDIVRSGNYHKFSQNPALGDYLRSTGGRVLAEASPHDCIWGIGLAADDPRARNPWQWRGENLLGFALMEVRDALDSGQP